MELDFGYNFYLNSRSTKKTVDTYMSDLCSPSFSWIKNITLNAEFATKEVRDYALKVLSEKGYVFLK